MEKLEVLSPFNQEQIETIALGDEASVETALSNAQACLKQGSKQLLPYERIEILEKLVLLMQENKQDLIQTALLEGGKPYQDTVVEVDRAINGVKLAIAGIHELAGKEVPMGLTPSSRGRFSFSTREPIGIVVSLSAFNHPLNLVIHQVVPAIAAGCPVIIKPALTTPLTCLKFVKLVYEAGLPQAWCQAIVCSNELAERLVTDKRVAYLSFIGSANVGWYLRSKLSAGTRCGLEHGGVAPVIVDSSAQVDRMLPSLIKGSFYHAGQVCVSVQRVFVCAGKEQEVADALATLANELQVGDPALKETQVGPLILPRELDRISSWVQEAKSAGAQVLSGGQALSSSCYKPTVLLNPPSTAKVSREEIFGPVVCVYGCDSLQEAVLKANELPYAFQASIFTKDIDTAFNCSEQLNATAVMINDHTAFRVDWMPFGGRDASGLGMGGISHSLEELTREKLRVFNISPTAGL